MPSSNRTVLVAGAGPSGLVLALALAQNHVPVRIISKEPTARIGQKGTGMQPRTLELYNLLRILPSIKQYAVKPPMMRTYDVDPALPAEERGKKAVKTWPMVEECEIAPSRPCGGPFGLSQARQEDAMRNALEKLGVQVEYGTELVDFTQNENGVEARVRRGADATEESINVGWLVGTDGAKGVTRKNLGFKYLGQPHADVRVLLGDVRLEGNIVDREHRHMWVTSDKKMVSLFASSTAPDDSDLYFLMIRGPEQDLLRLYAEPTGLQSYITDVAGRTDIKLKSVDWVGDYHPSVAMVEQFSKGRVFIAGDAAHVHAATGGQGLNSSVQDSLNLAWKLTLVTKGLASPQLLETYDEERLPVIAEMLNLTTDLLKSTAAFAQTQKDSNVSQLTNAGKVGAKVEPSLPPAVDQVWRRPAVLHMLGVNYRWSSIVLDHRFDLASSRPEKERTLLLASAYKGGDHLRAGDRAPDAPSLQSSSDGGMETSLFQLFTVTRHTALVFVSGTSVDQGLVRALAAFPEGTMRTVAILPRGAGASSGAVGDLETLVDSEGHAYQGYEMQENGEGVTVVIVRPDGYVGAVANDEQGVEWYRKMVFGSA